MSKMTIRVHETKKCEDLGDARKALAKELGVPVRNVKESSKDYDYLEPEYVLDVKMKDGETATYCVYDNQQSAYDAAVDDLGEQFRNESTILGAAIAYFGFDTFKDFVNGLDDSEMEDLENLSNELGEQEFADYVHNRVVGYGGVDFRGFAEYNIDRLDPAWHLAIYDSEEVELENGMLAYRVD